MGIFASALTRAVRAINSPESVPTLLKVLDDPYADNGFIAMQALIELTGGGPINWVPSFEQFRENRAYYAATCRECLLRPRQVFRSKQPSCFQCDH